MKQRVQIITVDPANRIIEFLQKDGVLVAGQVWEVPAFFRWPKQNEYWTVSRTPGTGSYWTLGERMEDVTTVFPVEKVKEGEAKISAARVIYTDDGSRLAVYSGAPNQGDLLQWNATAGLFAPVPTIIGFDVGDVKWTSRKYAADPSGWLIADARALLANTPYAALRAALVADGKPYGADGSGNPLIPDGRDRVAIGVNPTALTGRSVRALGDTGGEESHLLTGAESGLPNHNHALPQHDSGSEAAGYGLTITTGFADRVKVNDANTVTQNSFGSGTANAATAHNNMQPYLALTLLVKT